MSTVPDQVARDRARDPEGSLIVQAPAGSGKTELLTQRFLALLPRVRDPEEIVAITFTRKAAGEMRNRILKALDDAAGPAPAEAHARTTWALGGAALARDQERGWQLRENPGRLRVLTIDALCAALARRMPLLSGLGAPAQVSEDAAALYREAARETLADLEGEVPWADAVAALVRHRDCNLADLESLLADMLARRDQWLRHLFQNQDPEERRWNLEQALEREVARAVDAVARACPADLARELLALGDYAGVRVEAESPVALLAGLTDLPGSDTEDLPLWLGVAAMLLTGKGEWRKPGGLRKDSGFPAPSEKGIGAEEKRLRQAMKARAVALLESLAGKEDFRERLHALRELPPPHLDEAQWAVLDALHTLLLAAAGQLELSFRRHGSTDFAGVSMAALRALGDEDAPTDLALSLDYRIQHLLVDEFQDTSEGQKQLLERLTAGWEPGDGRTLFVVGDPMQSIYRFREAEVGIYLQARRGGVGSVPLEPLTLETNFRSQAGVVDWVNAAFRRVLPPRDDVAAGAVAYAPARAHRPELEGPAVTVHAFFDGDRQGEARRVVALVGEALAADAEGSVAVLVRSRPHLHDIVPALRAAGLRYRAVEIEPLAGRFGIQDLMALTRALVHPADRVAWLAVLRAPWCALTLSELCALCGDEDVDVPVWQAVTDPGRRARLDDAGRDRLERLVEALAPSLDQRRRLPLARAVEAAWLALGGPACLTSTTALEEARMYLALLEGLDAGGDLPDTAALAEAVGKLHARPDLEAEPRLQLMTIHKAKGLEFDTVIVPGLGRQPRNEDSGLLEWLERPRADDGGSELLIAPLGARGGEGDPVYRYIRKLNQDKARHEAGRLLYVAATRARGHLHLLGDVRRDDEGSPKAPARGSLLERLWPVVEEDFTRQAGEGAVAAPAPSAVSAPPLRRLTPAWHLPPPPPAVTVAAAPEVPEAETNGAEPVAFRWAGEVARHAGTVVHELLQHWERWGGHDPAAAWEHLAGVCRARLAQQGLSGEDLDEALGRVRAALAAIPTDRRGRWVLDPGHGEIRNEYPLTGVHQGRRVRVVIDRTFVDADGVRWIIDYKTGTHEGGDRDAFLDAEQTRYRPQLERYAALMRAFDPHRPIRLGLYFPLLQGWREWEAP